MADGEKNVYELARAAQKKAVLARKRLAARRPAAAPPGNRQSPTQKLGHLAENRARRHLESAGATFLCRNLRCKTGEIDLVFRDRTTLVFVEVRRRSSDCFGGAAASVNRQKQRRLIRPARFFLPAIARRHFQGMVPACRFDGVPLRSGVRHVGKKS